MNTNFGDVYAFEDRTGWYYERKNAKSFLFKFAKMVLLAWLLVMPLLTLTTVLEYRAMVAMEYKASHSFVPVK